MFKVSKDWTLEERLAVTAELGARLQGLAQKLLPQVAALRTMFDYGERIYLVSVEPTSFLEDNRTQILEGIE